MLHAGHGETMPIRHGRKEVNYGPDGSQTGLEMLAWVFYRADVHIMRTNIVIDDELMAETLRATGLKTKREAVELGLRTLLKLRHQEEIRKFRGKLLWEGDLDQMRTER